MYPTTESAEASAEQVNLQTIADILITAGTRTGKQLQRNRLEAEWCIKKQPTKPQAEPCGLFEQQQEELL